MNLYQCSFQSAWINFGCEPSMLGPIQGKMFKHKYYIADMNPQWRAQFNITMIRTSNIILSIPWALARKEPIYFFKLIQASCWGCIIALKANHKDMHGIEWKPSGWWMLFTFYIPTYKLIHENYGDVSSGHDNVILKTSSRRMSTNAPAWFARIQFLQWRRHIQDGIFIRFCELKLTSLWAI